MSGRRPSSSAAIETAARTRPSVAPVARASGSSTGSSEDGSDALGGDGGPERLQLGGVGEVADGDEVPGLLEAVVAGELGGVVAAVVEVAGLAVDVADGGVGDGNAVEAGRDIDQGGHDVHAPAVHVVDQH